MASQDLLKEFLVSIGFKVDEASQKAAFRTVESLGKDLLKLSVIAEGAAIGIVAALAKVSRGFEDAYYQSSRTGSAVKDLNAFKYAAAQMGSSAEEAAAAVENLALKIRENRGYRNLVASIPGADVNHGTQRMIESLHKAFASMSSETAHVYANMIGLPEHLLLALRDHYPEFEKFEKEYKEKIGRIGFDPQKAAEDGREFSRQYRSMIESIGIITDRVVSKLVNDPEKPLQKLIDYLDAHGAEIAKVLEKIANALLSFFTILVKHLPDIDRFAESMGGWGTVMTALATIVSVAFVGRMAGLFVAMRGLSLLAMPPWLLAILGVGAAGAAGIRYMHEENKNVEGSYADAKREQAEGGGSINRVWRVLTGKMSGNDAIMRRGRKGRENFVGGPTKGGWWTPERQKHAFDKLVAGGMPEASAIALISRWKNVESPKGPTDLNPKSGAYGIIQGLGNRKPQSSSIDDQLDGVLREFKTGSGDGAYVKASVALANAKTDAEAALGASAYERAEGYVQRRDGTDNYTERTRAGMAEVRRNVTPHKMVRTPPMIRIKPATQMPEFHSITPVMPGTNFNAPTFATPPIGAGGPGSNDNSRSITIHDNKKIEIHGTPEPEKAADHIGRINKRDSSSLLRNVQSAVG